MRVGGAMARCIQWLRQVDHEPLDSSVAKPPSATKAKAVGRPHHTGRATNKQTRASRPTARRGEASDVVQSQVRARALVRHVRHDAWRTAVIRPQWNEQSAHYVRAHASATRSLESLEVQEVNAFDFGAGGDRMRQPHEGAPTSTQQFEADHRLTTHPPTNARPPSLGPPLLSAARPMLVCLSFNEARRDPPPTSKSTERKV